LARPMHVTVPGTPAAFTDPPELRLETPLPIPRPQRERAWWPLAFNGLVGG
jgi:hypothetical protein